ncbi:17-beta-hydroxysteroid dehydrogenase type 6-like [Brevipalpus obovatus]|uniref:17-beta-hydroxysteroid dehydrogenase type 6-like n=1 Tax=Brevipalpus obovatus TaxID=246614 RepID=UPI003D9E1590
MALKKVYFDLLVFLFSSTLVCIIWSVSGGVRDLITPILLHIATGLFILFAGWQVTLLLKKLIFIGYSVDPSGKAVLITGCDTGFGHSTALELNKKGFKVYATCLFPNGDGAHVLRNECKFPDRMKILAMDIRKKEDIKAAHKEVEEDLQSSGFILWALINNAGIFRWGPIEWGDFDDHIMEPVRVNQIGTIMVTRTFLPLIRASHGRITNVTSATGRKCMPYMGAYSMSKFALIAFCEALRWELRRFGVKVISIEPAVANTAIASFENINNIIGNVRKETSKDILEQYSAKTWEEMFALTHFSHFAPQNAVRLGTIEAICRTVIDYDPEFSIHISPFYVRILFILMNLVPERWTLLFATLFPIFSNYRRCKECKIFDDLSGFDRQRKN